MRKLIGIAVVVALLSFVGSAFGAVAVNDTHDDVQAYVGEATNINFEGQDVSFDGSKVTVLANGHKDGVTTNVSTESNLLAAALNYGVINISAGSAKSIALANGTPGQMVTITMSVYDGKTVTITNDQVSPAVFTMTKTGWDDIAFDSVLDTVTLLFYNDTVGWVIIGSNAVTVT